LEESIKQLALISSVLGGFSFTFLSAILAMQTTKKTKFWLLVTLMIASMCFLLASLGWSMMDFNKDVGDARAHHQTLVKILLLGLISIIASLGLSGWLNDRKTGMATSMISILALLFLVFGILSRYLYL
jgi:cytochrome bd-type quinol oxidase subunit 2